MPLTSQQIEDMVKEKFPFTEREKNCFEFACRQDYKRIKYRKLLAETITEETFNNAIATVDGQESA